MDWYPSSVGKRGAAGEDAGYGGAFAELLRGMREVAGLTQEELASRAGLSPNAVGALERGVRRRPYPHTVRSLADALELSADERASLLAAIPGRGGAPSDASEASHRRGRPCPILQPLSLDASESWKR